MTGRCEDIEGERRRVHGVRRRGAAKAVASCGAPDGNRVTAEDLLQEALIRTYLNWGKIRPEGAYSYTRKIPVNLNTDRWRRRHLEPVLGDLGERQVAEELDISVGTVKSTCSRALARLGSQRVGEGRLS